MPGVRALVSAVAMAALAACSAVPASGEHRPDLTDLATWLVPEEVENGRRLTLAGVSDLEIHTPSGCLVADPQQRAQPLEPDLLEFAALLGGAKSPDGRRIDPLANMAAAINGLRNVYRLPSGQAPTQLFSVRSLKCRASKGDPIPEESLEAWPDRIQLHLSAGAGMPELPAEWNDPAHVKVRALDNAGRRYCRLALKIEGRTIIRSRIDVLGPSAAIPKYRDIEAMDCVMRGLIASFGFTGIMRFNLREIYLPTDFEEVSRARGIYTNRLLTGFEAVQERARAEGKTI